MRLRFFSIVCFITVCCAALDFAQPKGKIVHYSTEDGLSHDNVTCVLKDHEGFMWFGTWDGINRFDGHNFVSYKSRSGDDSKLHNNRIDQIVEDAGGMLWLRAYDNQIYRFDKKHETFLPVTESIGLSAKQKQKFTYIYPIPSGDVWLVTESGGVYRTSNPGAAMPKFVHYGRKQPGAFSLPSNNVKFIYEDRQKSVWMGTDAGLCRLGRKSDGAFVNQPAGFMQSANLACTSITEVGGVLWLGMNDGTVFRYNEATQRADKQRISANAIKRLYFSKTQPAIYAVSATGELITVDRNSMRYEKLPMPASEQVLSVYEDRSGTLWLEPHDQGVIRYNPITRQSKKYTQTGAFSYHNLTSYFDIFEDNKGLVWINMKGGGFGYYNQQKDNITYFFDGHDGFDARLSSLVRNVWYDKAGVLWINSDDGGLFKVVFQPNEFNFQSLNSNSYDKNANEVRGLCADRNGKLWVATKDGKLYVKDPSGKPITQIFANAANNSLGQIYAIFQDHTGVIWLGTKADGLYRATPTSSSGMSYHLEQFKNSPKDAFSISSNEIYTIAEDNLNRLWVGTFDSGLNLVEPEGNHLRFLNRKNYFKNYPADFEKIRNIGIDPHDRLWVATTNGLVIMDAFDRDANRYHFITYSKKPGDKESLANNDVQYICADKAGRMWMATSGGGVNMASGNGSVVNLKFQTFSTANGLPNDYVLSCIEDDSHNIWMATQKGLTRYNPFKRVLTNFDSNDGLPQARFAESACDKLPDGSLVLGTFKGYVKFNPSKVVNNQMTGRMVFTNLQVNNRDVNGKNTDRQLDSNANYIQHLELKHDENVLNIGFTVLDYRSSNKQNYQYRLKNFDTGWQNSKDQRLATYTNLSPGNYVFEVRCINSELYSNVPYKSLAINIAYPFWRTWWAYLCYLIIAVCLLEFGRRTIMTMLRLRHRIAVEQKLGELKMTFFTNVSHELRTPLTLILNPIEEIAQKEQLSAEGQAYIGVVKRNANRMVRFINQLLDLRKIQSGKAKLSISETDMVDFINLIMSYFAESAKEKSINLQLEFSQRVVAWIDVEKVDIVIYNLLANAVKFSPAGKTITINLKAGDAPNWFSIEVADEGSGVPNEQLTDIFELYFEGDHAEASSLKGTGIGLALSKELIELHHGKIAARNLAGGGFAVKVDLQLGRAHFNHEEAMLVASPALEQAGDASSPDAIATPITATDRALLPKLLIVEDNQEMRSFLKQRLGNLFQIEVAENGEDGIQKATTWLPDIIISDVMMPVMDGIKMLGILKNMPETSHIPIVLLTARSEVEHQIEGMQYGADIYITKPFQTAYLTAALNNLLAQRSKLFEAMTDKTRQIKLAPGELVITTRDEAFLQEIIRIVEKRMIEPDFSIEQVTEILGMSRTAFYTKFKSLTNLAPIEFVRDMRMKRGKQYLDAGETNISTIAYSIGFNNAKYFSTCFKEAYQMTPTEYIKSRKTVQ
ncbi:two component regulator with propeller domain [Mucilaginibacter yixingensis]|uniref:histidine kinase n=1 Tax=Mucilaginibacter yixingensis TaxID=1295612 RepID=A0A2T5JAJ0_9SPHI|nr:hybrid sensor histidine kinase/response regulator transcription factor [Mucilaginibacter yixingensis]PTQ97874.1 two component regulator with propeller domain [Mucilaginibacter yixingensis]